MHAAEGGDLERRGVQTRLRGIVSKKVTSPYKSGNSKAWIKIRNPKAAAVLRVADERAV